MGSTFSTLDAVSPGLSVGVRPIYKPFGVSRNPWGCPFRVPDPTICPQMLIPVAELSTQPERIEIRLLRFRIPLRSDQTKGCPTTAIGDPSENPEPPGAPGSAKKSAFPEEPIICPNRFMFGAAVYAS